jgi:folate-binding protein YgfZ
MTALVRPERGAFFDLSARAKFRITGADRLRYLNGQLSNDLRKASESSAIHACVLNAKGKVNADVFVSADGESFLLDSDAGVRDTLPARLERYIIADDVQVEDVSEQFALLHVTGTSGIASEFRRVRARRFDCEGCDIWLPREERETVRKELSTRFPECDESCAEVLRIERGIPRWGRELSEEIIPTEANLEADAIDYTKGCYIGQEVISRIKMSGQTNKRLCGLVSNEALPPNARLTSAEGKDAGWITSATWSPVLQKNIALGFVKRGFTEADLEAAERFYAGVLGFPVVERWFREGDAVWVMAGEQTRIGLWKPQIGFGGGRGGVHVHYALHIDESDFDDAVAVAIGGAHLVRFQRRPTRLRLDVHRNATTVVVDRHRCTDN